MGSVVDSFLKKSRALHSVLTASPDPAVWLFSFTLYHEQNINPFQNNKMRGDGSLVKRPLSNLLVADLVIWRKGVGGDEMDIADIRLRYLIYELCFARALF